MWNTNEAPAELIGSIRQALIDAVGKADPAVGYLGSDAGKLVRACGFDATQYKYGKLRSFIDQEVPELKVIYESAAGDIRWGLAAWSVLRATPTVPREASAHPATALDDATAWRTWASPQSPFTLRVSTSGSVRLAHAADPVEDEEQTLAPLNAEGHIAIARRFLETAGLLPDDARKLLAGILEQSPGGWWFGWSVHLRQLKPSANPAWLGFRQRALEQSLGDALEKLPLSEPARTAAKAAIIASRVPHARRTAAESEPSTPPPPPAPPPDKTPPDKAPLPREPHDLAALVMKIIPRLTAEQLRILPLPVGLVLDALRESEGG